MVESLRGEGAPPPAVRAVVHAALHYVDAELLNALVLRRDCCSISAIKALQASPCAQSVCMKSVVPLSVHFLFIMFCIGNLRSAGKPF